VSYRPGRIPEPTTVSSDVLMPLPAFCMMS
jgi:hypothetical protein